MREAVSTGTLQREYQSTIKSRWRNLTLFSHWSQASKKTRILLVGVEPTPANRLLLEMCSGLLQTPDTICDPFWFYSYIHHAIIGVQHATVFSVRDLVEGEERRDNLTPRKLKPNFDYPRLHDVARYTLTVVEVLDVIARTVGDIVTSHSDLLAQQSELDPATRCHWQILHQELTFQSHMIFSISRRCASYHDRIRNEIQQAFNLVAQEDARTSVDIAAAARADSQAMTSMAFVTLIFLPPTFISAVFSTTFFEFGPDRHSWSVSDKFYIYWIFVIPTTVIVGLIYQRRFLRQSTAIVSSPQSLARRMTGATDGDILPKMESPGQGFARP